MPVIIRKVLELGGARQEVKTYQPSGAITKEERVQADELDAVLAKQVPRIAAEILADPSCKENTVLQWFTLGRRLREIVDDRRLVRQEDVENGLIWQAVSHFLPPAMVPERSNPSRPYAAKQHKRQDHFSLCYELSKYPWDEVKWIKKWSYVHEVTARPALLRDRRIFEVLGAHIASLARSPTIDEFREIMKLLAREFPTRNYRESLLIADAEVRRRVKAAVAQIVDSGK